MSTLKNKSGFIKCSEFGTLTTHNISKVPESSISWEEKVWGQENIYATFSYLTPKIPNGAKI